jgi:hypothetical protein
MVTMLAMMTGNFDQTLFWDAQVPWVAVALLVLYVLLMVVVLFNLLIAIMGNAFQRVSWVSAAVLQSLFLKSVGCVLLGDVLYPSHGWH